MPKKVPHRGEYLTWNVLYLKDVFHVNKKGYLNKGFSVLFKRGLPYLNGGGYVTLEYFIKTRKSTSLQNWYVTELNVIIRHPGKWNLEWGYLLATDSIHSDDK